MTSAHLRKLAAVVALALGLVFVSSAAHADAAASKHTVKSPTVHSVQVAPNSGTSNTFSDWWL